MINVVEYGCHTDGVSDCSAVLTEIAQAAASRSIVPSLFLPALPNGYALSAPLGIYASGQAFAGEVGTVLKNTTPGGSLFTNQSGGRAWACRLATMTLDNAPGVTGGICIDGTDLTDCRYTDLSVARNTGHGWSKGIVASGVLGQYRSIISGCNIRVNGGHGNVALYAGGNVTTIRSFGNHYSVGGGAETGGTIVYLEGTGHYLSGDICEGTGIPDTAIELNGADRCVIDMAHVEGANVYVWNHGGSYYNRVMNVRPDRILDEDDNLSYWAEALLGMNKGNFVAKHTQDTKKALFHAMSSGQAAKIFGYGKGDSDANYRWHVQGAAPARIRWGNDAGVVNLSMGQGQQTGYLSLDVGQFVVSAVQAAPNGPAGALWKDGEIVKAKPA
jgi:hypothetical protein